MSIKDNWLVSVVSGPVPRQSISIGSMAYLSSGFHAFQRLGVVSTSRNARLLFFAELDVSVGRFVAEVTAAVLTHNVSDGHSRALIVAVDHRLVDTLASGGAHCPQELFMFCPPIGCFVRQFAVIASSGRSGRRCHRKAVQLFQLCPLFMRIEYFSLFLRFFGFVANFLVFFLQ